MHQCLGGVRVAHLVSFLFRFSLCHVRALHAFLDCPFLNAPPVFSLKCSSFVHLDISIISNGGILDGGQDFLI